MIDPLLIRCVGHGLLELGQCLVALRRYPPVRLFFTRGVGCDEQGRPLVVSVAIDDGQDSIEPMDRSLDLEVVPQALTEYERSGPR